MRRRNVDVVFVHRRPGASHFSVERVYSDVRAALPPDIRPRVWQCRFESRGVSRRLANLLEAPLHQGMVTHVTGDVGYVALGLRRRGTVLTVLDLVMLNRLRGRKRALGKLLWYELPIRRCAAVVTISNFVRQELLEKIPAARSRPIHVVHVPVSAEFAPKRKPFDAERPVVLMIGSAWNKNLERQVDALAGIRCHVEMVGEVSAHTRNALLRRRISFNASHGLSRTRLYEKYVSADLLLFASVYEGFGMPIIEANAVGRPVVTANVCSMPEVAGNAACLVDPYDSEAIRAGVVRVIEDAHYRESLVENGYANARRFSASAVAAQYADIYRAIAQGGQRRW